MKTDVAVKPDTTWSDLVGADERSRSVMMV